MRVAVSLFVILILYLNINAFTLDDKLSDKNMEKQATNLFEIIKCPICSGESLSESQSQLAYDMRKIIRKKISDGANNKEIISELKSSYGDSIIITPPVRSSTYILWCIPLITLLIGCFLIKIVA
ncbi:cytochrome c-type biogenesis protein CcmH [Wolbachia endosymbiont (group E) of Neria commutata]|uniref:cytochrome c-type biogenesis protein n=1 Tax=Wolbachia endosymbiont (group E) of Neria commutata TaxID=3066149 RepID=UPI003132FFF5